LEAAEGTFKGELKAAKGTFEGNLVAGKAKIGNWQIIDLTPYGKTYNALTTFESWEDA
jgi:hypothetical protein